MNDKQINKKYDSLGALPIHKFEDIVLFMQDFINADKIIQEMNVKNEDAVRVMAEGAINFTHSHVNILHTWQGLVTGNWSVSSDHVDAAFMDMTLHMNTNPFYDLYKPLLAGPMLSAQIRWITGRIFDSQGETPENVITAYVCMSGLFDIFPVVVYAFYSTIDVGSPAETQKVAMRKAHEFSVAMQSIRDAVPITDYLKEKLGEDG